MLGWPTRTRRTLTTTATVAALAATALVGPVSGAVSGPAAAASRIRSAPDRYENRVVYWTNVKRRQHGLDPVRARACTDSYAESWARHLARTTSFRHQDVSRMFSCARVNVAGENLARGGFTPRQVVNAWMGSPGHRANLLKPRYTHIGVGSVRSFGDGRLYTAQTFTGR